MSEKEKKEKEIKKPTIADLLPQDEETAEDEQLYSQLVGQDGKLKVDLSMPEDFMVDIMASQMVEHMVSYEQSKQTWISSRNQGNHARAKQFFEQMQFNQLTVAIIQARYPEAKKLADEIMNVRAKQAQQNRRNTLKS